MMESEKAMGLMLKLAESPMLKGKCTNLIVCCAKNCSFNFNRSIDAPAHIMHAGSNARAIVEINPLLVIQMLPAECYASKLFARLVDGSIDEDDFFAHYYSKCAIEEFESIYTYLMCHELFHRRYSLSGVELRDIIAGMHKAYPDIPVKLADFVANVIEDATIQRLGLNDFHYNHTIKFAFDKWMPIMQGTQKAEMYIKLTPESIRDKLYFFITYFYSQSNRGIRAKLVDKALNELKMPQEIIDCFNDCVSLNDSVARATKTYMELAPMVYEYFLIDAKSAAGMEKTTEGDMLDASGIAKPDDETNTSSNEGTADDQAPDSDSQSDETNKSNSSSGSQAEDDSDESDNESEDESEGESDGEGSSGDDESEDDSDSSSSSDMEEGSDGGTKGSDSEDSPKDEATLEELKSKLEQALNEAVDELSPNNDIEDLANDDSEIEFKPGDGSEVDDMAVDVSDATSKDIRLDKDHSCILELNTFYNTASITFEDLFNSGIITRENLDEGNLDMSRMLEPDLYGNLSVFTDTYKVVNALSMRLCFILDASDSMFNSRGMRDIDSPFYQSSLVIAALKTAFTELNCLSKVMLFSDNTYVLADYNTICPSMEELYERLISYYNYSGLGSGTEMLPSLEHLLNDSEFMNFPDSKLAIVLTDGDTDYAYDCANRIKKLQSQGVDVLAIYISNKGSSSCFNSIFRDADSIVISPKDIQGKLCQMIYEYIINKFVLI